MRIFQYGVIIFIFSEKKNPSDAKKERVQINHQPVVGSSLSLLAVHVTRRTTK